MSEKEVFELVKKNILIILEKKNKPVRVAINGIEGTGKTVFAKRLTDFLISQNFNAIHVSIDGFHFNRKTRYKQGRDSAEGYYEDSYDEESFVEKVLKSSQEENPHYIAATHDLETDEYLNLEPIKIDNKAILITDGSYLLKTIFRDHWDLKIYLKTSFETAMERGVQGDKAALGGFDHAKEKYLKRYHKASKMYIAYNNPETFVDIIIDNSDYFDLKILKIT